MKKITYCFMLLLGMVFSGHSQVQIGSGTVTGQHIPIEPYYGYTYSQSIYLASEISASGSITSIQWYYAGSGESGLDNSQDLTIYLGHTTKSAFASGTDWEPVTNLTEVYTGGIDVTSGPGWVTLELSTPFEYDGTSNLVVATKEGMEDYDEDEDEFSTFEVSGNRSLCYYNDDNVPNPSNPHSANYVGSYVPNIIFGGITQACPTPVAIVVSGIGTSSATITWEEPASAPSGGSDYYYSESNTPPGSGTVPSGNTLAGNSITIASGLNPATVYYVWVRNNCGSGLYSGWSIAAHFITTCVAVTEFNENFDSTPIEELPACWSSILRGPSLSEYAFVAVEDEEAHSAPNSAVLYDDESGSLDDIILVSPNLGNLSAGTHRLKFYAKDDYDTSQIQIGTLDGNSETATFTSYEDINTTSSATEYTVDFSGYSGTDTYIGIRMNALGSYNPIYIDNILWETNPTCPDVTDIAVLTATTAGATITWSPGGSETAWDVAIGETSVTNPNTLTPVSSTDTTKEITGLTDATSYNVWVRSACDGDDNGAWIGPIEFTTPCLPVNSFNETFESADVPELPSCWSSILRGDGLSEYAYIGTNDYDAFAGNNDVELYNEYSDPDSDIILVSPNLGNLSTGTYRLKFHAEGAYDSSNIQIGTLDGNTNAANFSVIEDVAVTESYAEYTVDFSSYSGTDTFIGMRLNGGEDSPIMLDNIIWEISPTCPDVTDITLLTATTTGATITWNPGGSETAWDVAVGETSVTDPNTLTPVSSTDTTNEITGLTDATSYNVWVRSACDGDDNGAWIGPIEFTTPCLPVNSFNETFESADVPDLPSCWSSILRGDDLSEYANVRTTDYDAFAGGNAVQLYNEYSGSSSDIILVSPNLGNLSAGTHRLKFHAEGAYGSTNIQIGTLDGNTNAANFSVMEDVDITGNYAEYTVDFSSFTGTDTFIGMRLNGGMDSPILLDNIIWEISPTCPDVTDITLLTATTAGATITWNPGGSETAWDVAIGETSVTDPNTLTPVSSTDTTKEITGLTDATSYNVWVRSACDGDDNGAWIGPIEFTTPCLPVNSFNETFESADVPELPSCWSSILRGDGLSEYAYIGTNDYDAFAGDNAIELYNEYSDPDSDIILVSPNLGNLSTGTYRLKFHAEGAYDSSNIQIGTLDGNSNTANFSVMEDVDITGSYAEYTVDFSSYSGTDTFIGMRLNGGVDSPVMLDNIIWEVAPTCADVTDVSVTGVTTTTADVSWASNGSETNWQVAYGPASVTDPATLTPSSMLTSTNTQLTGLDDATSYNVWVRSVCAAGTDNGAWIGPITFATQCLSTDVPYTQDFESVTEPNLPGCSALQNVGTGNDWEVVDDPGYGFNSNTLEYPWDGDNAANVWFFTQGINLTGGTEYSISYRYGNDSDGDYTENLKIMYGQSPDADGMTLDIADHPEISGASDQTNMVTFTPPTTGVYYFGFNAYSEADQDHLFVDDIVIDIALSINNPDNNVFSYYPNPVNDVLNLSSSQNMSDVAVYNLLGQKVLENSINANSAKVDMSGLSAGSYLVKVTADSQTKTIKVIKQ